MRSLVAIAYAVSEIRLGMSISEKPDELKLAANMGLSV
jgi:hypothetical protein